MKVEWLRQRICELSGAVVCVLIVVAAAVGLREQWLETRSFGAGSCLPRAAGGANVLHIPLMLALGMGAAALALWAALERKWRQVACCLIAGAAACDLYFRVGAEGAPTAFYFVMVLVTLVAGVISVLSAKRSTSGV